MASPAVAALAAASDQDPGPEAGRVEFPTQIIPGGRLIMRLMAR